MDTASASATATATATAKATVNTSTQAQEILSRSSWSWALLDQVGCALLLIDESTQLVYANAIAHLTPIRRRFAANGQWNGQALDGGSLRLRCALQNAFAGRAGVMELIEDRQCLLVAVSPIAIDSHRRGALITCEHTQLMSNSSFRMYARTLGLTPREIAVVDCLSRGCEPKTAAVTLDMSIETMRSHIKAVLAKSAATSLREFLLRVAKLPPVLEAGDKFAPRQA